MWVESYFTPTVVCVTISAVYSVMATSVLGVGASRPRLSKSRLMWKHHSQACWSEMTVNYTLDQSSHPAPHLACNLLNTFQFPFSDR